MYIEFWSLSLHAVHCARYVSVCASALCVLCMQRALFVFQTDVINSICLSLGLQFHFGCYRCRAHSNRIRQAFKRKPPRKLEFLCTGQMKRNQRVVCIYISVLGIERKVVIVIWGSIRFHSFLESSQIVICVNLIEYELELCCFSPAFKLLGQYPQIPFNSTLFELAPLYDNFRTYK